MADESDANQVEAPIAGVQTYNPMDEGLVAWTDLVHDNLVHQAGLEVLGRAGGSFHFKFRGQTFAVTIQRVS